MNDIQKELDQAFLLLDRIPVQGASVETMYAVRVRLRRAFQMAADVKEEEQNG